MDPARRRHRPGPAEIIEDGRTGLLVPDGDEEALADALRRLIHDEPLRRRLGAAAAEAAVAYEIPAVGAQWDALLASL